MTTQDGFAVLSHDTMSDLSPDSPPPKRPRSLPPWEASLMKQNGSPRKLGLVELFGNRSRDRAVNTNNAPNDNFASNGPGMNRGNRGNHRPNINLQENPHRVPRLGGDDNASFFTLRLEHRIGGPAASHRGEERLLIFRSDQRGAIGKIIFSSTPAKAKCHTTEKKSSRMAGSDEFDESELVQMAQAKIHVLDVKQAYRGHDLGGLLFSEAVAWLKQRYNVGRIACEGSGGCNVGDLAALSPLSSSIRCQLDAEEDVRRHNKLIGFYEHLGCRVKPRAKVTYINNNDGETYRKVPMQIALRGQLPSSMKDPSVDSDTRSKKRAQVAGNKSLIGHLGGFLPVQLLEPTGTSVVVQDNKARATGSRARLEWLLVEDGEGSIQFRTTHGHRLRAEPDGKVAVVSDDDDDEPMDSGGHDDAEKWANFNLSRVPDAGFDSDPDSDAESVSTSDEVRRKELWMLETSHGTFLGTDPVSHSLQCTKVPSFWQANDAHLSLTCTRDTPPRRQHYRKTWSKQNVDYVRRMRARYLNFGLKRMGIHEALNLVKSFPCHPFRLTQRNGTNGPSLRTLCFRTAEAVRQAGLPDWVQLIALVHALGRVVNFIDVATASDSEDDYDWTITSRSRVVGCAAPARATFGEFRNLNPDEADQRYNSPSGMYQVRCGLENVLLTWTGQEYMYFMLKHNNVAIPEEGLAMLRFFSLGDWHTHGEYEHLVNDDDEDVRPFVAEFDKVRRHAKHECGDVELMSDELCEKLWKNWYAGIVAKYSCDGELFW